MKELKELIKRVETEINKTPTSELRNLLCDINIVLQQQALNMPVVINWVAVADQIPPEKQKVICWNGYRMVEQSWMQYTGSDEEWFRRRFTHWTSDVKPPCL